MSDLPGRKYNVLSLFSGCGGLDLGFEGGFKVLASSINDMIHPEWKQDTGGDDRWVSLPKTRFNTVFANDIRDGAKAAWDNYFRKFGMDDKIYHLGSVVDLVRHHRRGESVFPRDVDVVTGGFPCQDFSVAGKRLGFKSPKNHRGLLSEDVFPSLESRGKLYMWMREVIEITKPKVFIAENVKGLVNLHDVKSIIERDFRSVSEDGYLVVEAKVLHSADYGVPQSRERVIFIGFQRSSLTPEALAALSQPSLDERFDPYPKPTHAYTNNGEALVKPVSLREALGGLLEPDKTSDLSQKKYSKAKYMGKHCQGQSEIRLSGIGPTIRSEHHGNIEFRRLSAEHGGMNLEELQAGLEERRLTVRECARIQTFPDDYEFVFPPQSGRKGVSASEAYKIIGNAVPPLLGYHIAHNLQSKWDLYFGRDS